jgi:hypothetical protein
MYVLHLYHTFAQLCHQRSYCVNAKQAAGTGESVDEKKPYAELWMGTHSSGPSSVVLPDGSKKLLKDYLGGVELPVLAHYFIDPLFCDTTESRLLCCGVVMLAFNAPQFLLKVLSIRLCLSIQAHPDKVAVHFRCQMVIMTIVFVIGTCSSFTCRKAHHVQGILSSFDFKLLNYLSSALIDLNIITMISNSIRMATINQRWH